MAGEPTKSEGSISPFTWIGLFAIVASLTWAGWHVTQKLRQAPAAHQPAQAAPAAPAPAPAPAPSSGGERMNG